MEVRDLDPLFGGTRNIEDNYFLSSEKSSAHTKWMLKLQVRILDPSFLTKNIEGSLKYSDNSKFTEAFTMLFQSRSSTYRQNLYSASPCVYQYRKWTTSLVKDGKDHNTSLKGPVSAAPTFIALTTYGSGRQRTNSWAKSPREIDKSIFRTISNSIFVPDLPVAETLYCPAILPRASCLPYSTEL